MCDAACITSASWVWSRQPLSWSGFIAALCFGRRRLSERRFQSQQCELLILLLLLTKSVAHRWALRLRGWASCPRRWSDWIFTCCTKPTHQVLPESRVDGKAAAESSELCLFRLETPSVNSARPHHKGHISHHKKNILMKMFNFHLLNDAQRWITSFKPCKAELLFKKITEFKGMVSYLSVFLWHFCRKALWSWVML